MVDNINELIKLIYPWFKTSELPILNAKSIFYYLKYIYYKFYIFSGVSAV